MGYRVDYGPMDRAMRKESYRMGGWPLLCAVFFLCFLILVGSFWPDGRVLMEKLLFPGDWQRLDAAAALFRDAAEDGGSVTDCVETFCKEILAGTAFGIG